MRITLQSIGKYRFILSVCIFLLQFHFFNLVSAQSIIPEDSASVLRVPFGYTNIGGEDYIGLRIQPELALGKIGVGLDVPLLFSAKDGALRTQEFQDGALGVLRMVRYFRYGQKKIDRYYFRIGDLSNTYMGTGFLMNNYTNSPSFERRKVGLSFDIRPSDLFGIEGTYSDFNNGFNLLAVRPYFRPLAKTGIPILKTLEIGGSFVTDYTPKTVGANAELIDTRFVKSGVNAYGADISLTVLNTSLLNLRVYGNYGRIAKNDSLERFLKKEVADSALANKPISSYALADGYDAGQGFSLGAVLRVDFVANIFNIEARLERLWYGQHFAPQFFDAVYEIDKDAKLLSLGRATGTNGIYGSLSAVVLNKIRFTGGLQIPDVISASNPALVFVNLEANEIVPKLLISGRYIKGGIEFLNEAFLFDSRSQANLRAAYRINKFLMAGVDVRWTFAKVTEDGVDKFKATEMVMPYVGFYYPLKIGK